MSQCLSADILRLPFCAPPSQYSIYSILGHDMDEVKTTYSLAHLSWGFTICIVPYIQYCSIVQCLSGSEFVWYVCRLRIRFLSLQLVNAGEDVLVFYNDRASFQTLVQMMRSERDRMDENSPLMYHIHLVELLAVCTEGKNVYTEIKCNSLLPLDDIVRVVTHEDCIPEVRWEPLNVQIESAERLKHHEKAMIGF